MSGAGGSGSSSVVQNIQAITSANRLSKGVIDRLEAQLVNNEALVNYYQGNLAYLSNQYKWLVNRIDSRLSDNISTSHELDYDNIKNVLSELNEYVIPLSCYTSHFTRL